MADFDYDDLEFFIKQPKNRDPAIRPRTNTYSDKQAIHDASQVKSLDEVKKGRRFILLSSAMHAGQKGAQKCLVEILAEPTGNNVLVKREYPTFSSVDTINLADYGIVPYGDGLWNCSHYLIPADK